MVYAWYFAKEDRKLRYGDGRKIKVGSYHMFKGEPITCQQGLHASEKLLDALNYAPGPILYKVKLGGSICYSHSDKLSATKRAYLVEVDSTKLLWEFARWCALQVVHLWEAPEIVIKFLKTGDEDFRAASRSAALAAEDAAARCHAREAREAAQAAAWAAALAAPREAALEAAREAREAALADAREAVLEADRDAREAARAALAAAREDARDAQSKKLEELFEKYSSLSK